MPEERQGLVVKLTQDKEMKAPAPMSEEDDAASDLIAAVKSGDAKAANLALKRHYELCQAGEYEDDDEEA